MHGDKCVGAVVCKLDMHKNVIQRGYIAMLAVEKEYRGRKIGMLYKLQYAIRNLILPSSQQAHFSSNGRYWPL